MLRPASLAALLAVAAAAAVDSTIVSLDRLPLNTRGRHITDKAGKRVRLACVNWYGAHMEVYSVFGLHKQPLRNISRHIADLGFNCIRMPISIALWAQNPPVPSHVLSANPDLQKLNLRGMELLDHTIKALTDAGLLIFLNDHTSSAGWCCDLNSEEGIWDNPAYNVSMWLDCVSALVRRYAHDPRVVAFDLRNEIHDTPTREITWGTSDDIRTDWKAATEAAAANIYEIDPQMLVVVSGLCSSCAAAPPRESARRPSLPAHDACLPSLRQSPLHRRGTTLAPPPPPPHRLPARRTGMI